MQVDFRLEVLSECGSTNEELFARRPQPDFHGLAILALRQTAGHGRRGRAWWSAEGNLALSVGFRLEADPAVTLIAFAAGLALADSLGEFLPANADLRLKWPNDVYVNGLKISGLITQARQSGESVDLVLGMGVNLRSAPPGMEAIALTELAPAPTAEEFSRLLLGHLKERLLLGVEDLVVEWEMAARIEGAALTILGEDGEYTGKRLLPSGELEVVDGQGTLRRLSSETVSLRFSSPRPSP